MSVRPSVRLIDQRRAAGLLLSAVRARDIDRQRRAPGSSGAAARRSAVNAGGVVLTTGVDDAPQHRPVISNKRKAGPYSITERRVPELIPVFGGQPAGDVSHKPGGRLPLLFATPAILKRAATSFAAW